MWKLFLPQGTEMSYQDWDFPETLIGTVAISDLLLNLPEWIFPLTSLLAGAIGSILGSVLGWAVFWCIFFQASGVVYAHISSNITIDWRFRCLVASQAFVFMVLYQVFSPDLWMVVSMGVYLVITGISFLIYLNWYENHQIASPETRIITNLHSDDTIRRSYWEARKAIQAGGVKAFHMRVVITTLDGFVLAFPCFLLGILASFFLNAYPLPDLVVLSGILLGYSSSTRDSSISIFDYRLDPDIEKKLFRPVRNSFENTLGITHLSLISIGIMISGYYITAGVLVISEIPSILETNSADFRYYWSVIGCSVIFLAAGCVAILVWFRQLTRLSGLIRWYEGDAIYGRNFPPRIFGMTIYPVVCFIFGFVFLYSDDKLWTINNFSIFWPMLGIAGYILIKKNNTISSEAIYRDRIYNPLAFLLQAVSTQITFADINRFSSIQEWITSIDPIFLIFNILMATVLGSLHLAEKHNKVSMIYLSIVFLLCAGLGILWGIYGTSLQIVGWIFGSTFIITAIYYYIAQYAHGNVL